MQPKMLISATIPFCVLLFHCRAETKFAGSRKKPLEATAAHRYSFMASEVKDASTELSSDSRYQIFNFEVGSQPQISELFQQIARPRHELIKKQGHDAKVTREEFAASSSGLLDLLVVIDDSKSMKEELKALSSKLEVLLSDVSETDWQVGVIKMSDARMPAANLIKKGEPNAAKKFENAVSISSFDPNAAEQGFPKAIQSLEASCKGCNAWLRPQSAVGVLIVSDEDNCGSDPGELARCNNIQGKNAEEMLSFLNKIRPGGMARVYGLLKQSANECPNAAGVGTEYMKAVVGTSGVSGSICASDYSTALSSISKNVSKIIRSNYTLSGTPDQSFFKVEADGVEVKDPAAWKISSNKVTINTDSFKGVGRIAFSYSHDAEPKFSTLTLDPVPALYSIEVRLNGFLLPDEQYQYDSPSKTLTFAKIPPDDSFVDIYWREDLPLKETYTIASDDVDPSSLQVFVNAVATGEDTYKRNDRDIVFTSPPTDGSLILVKYKTFAQRQNSFPISLRAHPSHYVLQDAQTEEPLESQIEDNAIVISKLDATPGRRLTMKVDYGEKSKNQVVKLPKLTLDTSVLVTLDDKKDLCRAQRQQSHLSDEISNTSAAFTISCDGFDDYTKLKVAYQFETPRQSHFQLPDSAPVDNDQQRIEYTVSINGTKTDQYQMTGNEFSIDSTLLPPGAKVDIDAKVWTAPNESH
jgi:hypothetical protein